MLLGLFFCGAGDRKLLRGGGGGGILLGMNTMAYLGNGDLFAGGLFAGGWCCCLGFYGTIFLVGILGTIFWIWMLVDVVTNEPSEGNDKIVWVLIVLFAHLPGALIYYFVRRPERIKKFGK